EPCPAQMLWAPLPLPAVVPNNVLRLASASTASITRSATNVACRCRRLLGAMLVSVLRPIGRLITDPRSPPEWPVYGFWWRLRAIKRPARPISPSWPIIAFLAVPAETFGRFAFRHGEFDAR